jgi:hypothetical protein
MIKRITGRQAKDEDACEEQKTRQEEEQQYAPDENKYLVHIVHGVVTRSFLPYGQVSSHQGS